MDLSNQRISSSSSLMEEEDCVFVVAMKLTAGSVLPMALRFAVELNLLQLIRDQPGETGASAFELAARIQAKNPEAASMIDRVLRLLAANSILTCRLQPHDGGVERRYSLAPLCKYFTANEEDGLSLSHILLSTQDRVFVETWYHLKDAVMEGGVPFDRAHGMNAFEYPATDPRFNKIFNQAMYQQSSILMKRVLEKYNGFEGVESLVDVGGGRGASLQMIIAKHPSIKAINFDLPHVIQDAPSFPGIEHRGGDMFVSVPKADAIFMKWICHDWSDSHVEKLLRNCYESLDENGKVVVAENILPEGPTKGLNEAWAVQSDVFMLVANPGGKERSESEFHTLATKAGFKRLLKVCYAYGLWIMEFHKS